MIVRLPSSNGRKKFAKEALRVIAVTNIHARPVEAHPSSRLPRMSLAGLLYPYFLDAWQAMIMIGI
jgi:hypothetical protein